MGQHPVKSAFRPVEGAERVKSLKSPDQLLKNFEELKQTLKEPRIRKELGFQVEIFLMANLKSPVTRVFYKFPGATKFRFRFQQFDGKYEETTLNLEQFYEFYERFQHFCLILGSQKINLKQTRDFVMSRLSQDGNEESKVGEVRRSEEKKSEEIKKLSDIASAESVMITNKRNSEGETPDGDEATSCVLCFAKQIGMLLPCYHGYCEKCCLDWYKVKGQNQCPLCRASITESDFDTKVFLVMSKDQEEEINGSIKEELIAYINSFCKKLKFDS